MKTAMGKENRNNKNGQLLQKSLSTRQQNRLKLEIKCDARGDFVLFRCLQRPYIKKSAFFFATGKLNRSRSICRRALTLCFSPLRSLKNSYTHGTFKPPTYRQLPYFITQPKPEGSGCRLYLILTHAVPALCDFDFLSPKPEKERTEKKSLF